MTASAAASPNTAQIEHWNGAAGDTWVRLQDRLDAQLAPLGRLGMERAAIREGWRINDIGCGTGQTSLDLARRVGPGGSVLAVDISRPMLALAERRRSEAGLANLRFEEGDAQFHPFAPGAADLVFSRFGVMFFADPVAAFGNLRAGLRRGGRLVLVTWRKPQDNPWVSVPMAAAFQHIPRPVPPEPGAPGEFAFADRDRVETILRGAGFREIVIEAADTMVGGSSLDLTVDTSLNMGPVAAALREAPAGKREMVAEAVREALAPFDGPEGVRLGAGVWLVLAMAP